MHSSRTIFRSPQVCRLVQAPAATRSISLLSHISLLSPFGPRFPIANFPSFNNDFAPLLRLMDDLASPRVLDHFAPPQLRSAVTLQPRFDVREIEEAYELRGELPGVENKDLEVQFTDASTLVIRGRTQSEEGTPSNPQAITAVEDAPQASTAKAAANTSDASSTHSASYQRPTVEDEDVAEASSTPGASTPAESIASEQQQVFESTLAPAEQLQATEAKSPSTHYWVSERRIGSFQRSFTFPGRIDQEAVKASLRNGVLNIVVPKAAALGARRIAVE